MLIPLAIQTAHALENHEHIVCKSITDHHVHKKGLDCSNLHQILEVKTTFLTSDFNLHTPIFYIEDFNTQPQLNKVVTYSRKFSRGPPSLA